MYYKEFELGVKEVIAKQDEFFRGQSTGYLLGLNSEISEVETLAPETYLQTLLEILDTKEQSGFFNKSYSISLRVFINEQYQLLISAPGWLNKSFIITGQIGLGKTVTMAHYAQYLIQSEKSVAYLAPNYIEPKAYSTDTLLNMANSLD
ncbi:hypothetical protein MHH81_20970 [Psychrobacillus sp. FSL H8-0484]|uniref:hypothetical protein n=1 Tax=Psychrobacillus sp. FSL H8-0484 TaxID=2921390 RepID=UPI0030F826B1